MICAVCGFRLYFNPAVAVAVFIQRNDGRLLRDRKILLIAFDDPDLFDSVF